MADFVGVFLKILFVCTGNICRSPLAEVFLKTLIKDEKVSAYLCEGLEIFSAGTSAYFQSGVTKEAIEIARKYGADLSLHRSRLLNKKMIEDADLILTMETRHREFAKRLAPGCLDKIFLLKDYVGEGNQPKNVYEHEISDPIGLGISAYEKCAKEIIKAIKKLIIRLDEAGA
ncbi:MAG TPA: low molecular weight protein arginine phosphatase [Actinobacteria bacterium]|nr:low molecular weight protein arginine phosphatase [Actinomycetota bacterium]